jgi:hypothetical protein
MHLYKVLSITIEYSASKTEVSYMIGVKQRYLLSPFIFNGMMDPLLELEQMKGNVIDESHSFSALAFADHLILLATTKDTEQRLLNHTESYVNNFGMRIAGEKCLSFEVRLTRVSWYISNLDVCLENGDKRPCSSADTYLCYLGVHKSPWCGLQYKDFVDQLATTLERCRGTHHIPHQKLSLTTPTSSHTSSTKRYRQPPDYHHLSHGADHPKPHRANRTPPKSIKKELLYCSKRDGSLDIHNLEALATSTALKQCITLLNSLDPAIHALIQGTRMEQ